MLRIAGAELSLAGTRAAVAARPFGVGRLRYQLLLGFLLAVLMPALFPTGRIALADIPTNPTVIGTSCALIFGLVLYRRLTIFPGARNIEYVFPAFTTSYALMVMIFFFARINYSRLQYGLSFAAAIILFLPIAMRLAKGRGHAYFVAPFGKTDRLAEIPDIVWVKLYEPVLPRLAVSGLAVDLNAEIGDEWGRLIADASLSGTPVYHVKQLQESLTGQVDIEHISENNFGSLIPNLGYFKIKLFIDVVTAVLALPVLLPIFALAAIAIKLDSPGPVFFRQTRIGYRGIVFRVFKFRTMQHEPDEVIADGRRQAAITEHHDRRVTRVGRFLRRTRIDELPQIFNIVRGEMSWIGPRPEAEALADWYEAELPFYRYRHIVRPGISGWAQVNQGHVAQLPDVHRKLKYDFYYIRYFSFWLDVLILIRTIQTVITGFGSK